MSSNNLFGHQLILRFYVTDSVLFFHICLFVSLCYTLFFLPSVSSSLLVICSFLFSLFHLNLPYSLFFLLSFIWILSHLVKRTPQSKVTMISKKQLTGGGSVILLSVTARCGPTLCLSENNATVYFKQQ
jgi:hypothetical protein